MKQNNIRVFIAVELDAALRFEIKERQDIFKKADADVKWVHSKNMHLTLKFLGDLPSSSIDDLCRSIKHALTGISHFEFELGTFGYFQEHGAPKVLWVGIGSGKDAVQMIEKALRNDVEKFCTKKERENFSAHITLGRVRSKKNIDKLISMLNSIDLSFSKKQRVGHLTLFQSQLTSIGPEYKTLSVFNLL